MRELLELSFGGRNIQSAGGCSEEGKGDGERVESNAAMLSTLGRS